MSGDDGEEAAANTASNGSADSPPRQRWGSRLEFLLSCISMSVGLGNVWRFPFTAYNNGGGAFLIPYIVVLLFIGKPLYYMELAMGQFSSHGSVKVWSIVPAIRGVGYGQLVATSAVLSYYVALMALTVFYLVASFSSVLPWTVCDPAWGADLSRCVDARTNLTQVNSTSTMGSSEMYFQLNVLKELPDIYDGIGLPEWRLTLCLLFSWFLLFLTLIRGVQSSGKVAYFTAIFPYVVLFTLLVRGVTLPGAVDGILFYITPKWDELLNPSVWYAAVTQSFFSLGVGFGTLIMFSSYNNFEDPVARDAAIVSMADMFTSLLAGFTIFSILGNLAHELDTTVDQVIRGGGTSLAFVSYPQALANFPVPQLFSVLFFLMLFTLGVGSASGMCACIITVIREQFPSLQQWMVAAGVCTAGFLLGLVYVTPGGQFVLTLVDYFGGGFIIFMLAIVETLAVQWIYGVENFCDDLEFMVGHRPGIYWRVCWAFLIPISLLAIFIYSLVTIQPLRYGSIGYPTGAIVGGWLVILAGLITVPICFIYTVRKARGNTLIKRIRRTLRPAGDWGPADNEQRLQWLQATGRKDPLKGRLSVRQSRPQLQPRRFSRRCTVAGDDRPQRTLSSTGRAYRRTVSHAPGPATAPHQLLGFQESDQL